MKTYEQKCVKCDTWVIHNAETRKDFEDFIKEHGWKKSWFGWVCILHAKNTLNQEEEE